MIPKTMNFFWGGTPMSFMRFLTLKTFRFHNPSWRMVLYTQANPCPKKNEAIKENEDDSYSGYDYRKQLHMLGIEQKTWESTIFGASAAHTSDLFQWWLLSTSGGYYSDMDIIYVAPMEKLPKDTEDVDCLFCLQGGGMAIGFVASSPGNSLFRKIYDKAIENYSPFKYQCTGTEAVYQAAGVWSNYRQLIRKGILVGTESLLRFQVMFPNESIRNISDSSIYPFDWLTYTKIFDTNESLPADCIGVHWFGGSKLSPKLSQDINPESVLKRDDIFCTHARLCLND